MTWEQQGRPSPAPHAPCPPQARFPIFLPQIVLSYPLAAAPASLGGFRVFFRRTFIPGEGPGGRGEELELPRSWARRGRGGRGAAPAVPGNAPRARRCSRRCRSPRGRPARGPAGTFGGRSRGDHPPSSGPPSPFTGAYRELMGNPTRRGRRRPLSPGGSGRSAGVCAGGKHRVEVGHRGRPRRPPPYLGLLRFQ